MRRYLLDTGPLTAYLLGRPSIRTLVEPWIMRQQAATSILVYGEITEYNKSFPDAALRQAQLRHLLRGGSPYVLTYAILYASCVSPQRHELIRWRLTR